jgi:hypothetical protein
MARLASFEPTKVELPGGTRPTRDLLKYKPPKRAECLINVPTEMTCVG